MLQDLLQEGVLSWFGYKAQTCGGSSCIPICFGKTTCPNGGVCIAPNQCDKCSPGFAKPKCEVCSSSRIPRVSYGIYRQYSAFRGIATLSCNQGYEVIGDGTAMCNMNGDWRSTSYCRRKGCSQPSQTIGNGEFELLNGSLVGNQALIKCDENYVLKGGPNFIQCLPTGIWSASSALCVPVCQDGWINYRESCYLFGRTDTNYTTARNFCLDRESSLVTVNSVGENNFLKATMKELSNNDTSMIPDFGYWNDLLEETTNGNEVWRDANLQLDPEVADWYKNQPDDHSGPQTCTMFWKAFNYGWADIECDAGKNDTLRNRFGRALCEKKKGI